MQRDPIRHSLTSPPLRRYKLVNCMTISQQERHTDVIHPRSSYFTGFTHIHSHACTRVYLVLYDGVTCGFCDHCQPQATRNGSTKTCAASLYPEPPLLPTSHPPGEPLATTGLFPTSNFIISRRLHKWNHVLCNLWRFGSYRSA